MQCFKNISTVCLLLFIQMSSYAQSRDSSHAFSIQQCVDYAKQHNLQVKNALLDYKIQQQDNRATTAAALPSVTGAAGITTYVQIPTTLLPGEFFGQPPGSYIPVKFGTKYNANTGITLQQTLFDGQVFVGLQARQTSLDYRMKNFDITEESIRANIYKVYYQLVVSKTQMQQLDANIDRTKNLLHVNTEMYKNGFAEKIDADKTSVQLANLETEKNKTQASINNGYLGLKFLMGMPVQDSLALTDSITEDKIKEGLLNDGIYKYTDRNDYQFLELGKKLNEYNIKRYKLSYIPTLSITGNYSKQAQRTKFDIFGNGDWFTTSYVGVNLAVPIFDGFQKDANIKKAKLQLQQTQNQLENLKISIDNDVLQATTNFHTAIGTMDYQQKNMQLAEQVYNQAQKRYEAGLGTTLEITNAQSDLRIAQSNYVSAMYDAIIAKIDYLKATGKLP